jgi:hypothetical protein
MGRTMPCALPKEDTMRVSMLAVTGTILICLIGNPLDAAAQQIGVKGGLNLASIS